MMKRASKAFLAAISERPPAVITQHLKFPFILIILIILQDIWKSGPSAANGQTLAAVHVGHNRWDAGAPFTFWARRLSALWFWW